MMPSIATKFQYVNSPCVKSQKGHEPISYRGELLNTRLHATVCVYTQFAECTGTDCKQNGITKKISLCVCTQVRTLYKQQTSHIYKTILKPICTYETQLWGTASTSNIEILDCFQSKALRMIVDAILVCTQYGFPKGSPNTNS
jgi:hypothetical protein